MAKLIKIPYRSGDIRLAKRPLFASLVMTTFLILGVILALGVGSIYISFADIFSVLTGSGTAIHNLLVEQVRMPRIVAALTSGFALGVSGCLIQMLVRNRLATPDMVGVNEGATIAVVLMVSSSLGASWPWWGGPIGALLAFIFLVFLSGHPGKQGYRLIVIGLAVAELLRSTSDLLISMQEITQVNGIYIWKSGSLSGQGYEVSVPVLMGLSLCIPLLLLLHRKIKLMQFNEETILCLGVSLKVTQIKIFVLSVIVAGLACGISGPVAFIAMGAPIIAYYATGPGHVPVWSSGLVGALLVLLADSLGRSMVFSEQEIGVGIITSLIGGPLLLWLLISDKRTG